MVVVPRGTNTNWIAAVLLPLMVILMEVLWVYPWLVLVGRWPAFVQPRPPLSPGSVVFLLGASFLITKFSLRRKWPLLWSRLSIIALGVVAIMAVIRIEYLAGSALLDGAWFVHIARVLLSSFSHPHPVVVAIAVGFYLWWRGIGLGHSPLFFGNIYRAFSFGLLAIVVFILAWEIDPRDSSISTAGFFAAGFFFCGLSALGLAKLRDIQKRGRREGASPAFSGRWLSIIIVIIGGIVLVGIGIASVFSTGFLSGLGQVFNLVYLLLGKVVIYISGIVAFLVAVSIYIVQFIINILRQEPPSETFLSANLTAIGGLQPAVSSTLPPQVVLALKWGFFALVIAGALFLLARAISRYWSFRTRDDIEESHESLWNWGGFLTDLRLFLSLLGQRFRSKIQRVLPEVHLPVPSRSAGATDRLSIREIYQRLLWQAAQLGLARQRQETPYEYGKRLGQALPEGTAPLSELTDLYVDVRYGDLITETKRIDYANGLWREIQESLDRVEAIQAKLTVLR